MRKRIRGTVIRTQIAEARIRSVSRMTAEQSSEPAPCGCNPKIHFPLLFLSLESGRVAAPRAAPHSALLRLDH